MVDEEPFVDVLPLNRYLLIITNKKSNLLNPQNSPMVISHNTDPVTCTASNLPIHQVTFHTDANL